MVERPHPRTLVKLFQQRMVSLERAAVLPPPTAQITYHVWLADAAFSRSSCFRARACGAYVQYVLTSNSLEVHRGRIDVAFASQKRRRLPSACPHSI